MTVKLRALAATAMLWPLAAAALDDRLSFSQDARGGVRVAIWRVEATCRDVVGEVSLHRTASDALELRAAPQPPCPMPKSTDLWTRYPSLSWHEARKLADGNYTFTWKRWIRGASGRTQAVEVRRAFSLEGGRLATPATKAIAVWYRALAGREGDAGGLAYWTGMAETFGLTGASPQEALRLTALAFAQSPEVLGRAGTEADWVTKLFVAFIGRDVDPAAKAYWTGRAVATGRMAVARALLQSPEGLARIAAQVEAQGASRPEVADAMAILGGLAPLAPDVSMANQLVTRFMAAACVNGESPEYVDTYRAAVREAATQVPAMMGPKDRVAGLYEAIFGRAPDEAGAAYWSGRLERGEASWAQVTDTMVTLPEVEPLLRRKGAAYCAYVTPT